MKTGHPRRAARGILSSKKTVDSTWRSDILPEALFTRMLGTERDRAERANRRLILMLIESEGLLKPEDPGSTEEIQHAITCATRETDIKGWYREGTIIGVIFTEIPLAETFDVQLISRKVTNELDERLGAKIAKLQLSFHVFSEHGAECHVGETESRPRSAQTAA